MNCLLSIIKVNAYFFRSQLKVYSLIRFLCHDSLSLPEILNVSTLH